MQVNEQIKLTDGKGTVFTAAITGNNKKKCAVEIFASTFHPQPRRKVSIAISLLKNNSRFEWFLEKATEIGISKIIPLQCERTEKHYFRYDRMEAIMKSAILQSQQVWLPLLSGPVLFRDFIGQASGGQKYIAYCGPGNNKQLFETSPNDDTDHLVMIGPEGDFTNEEIREALQTGFLPVSLGSNRLRTETAGIVACTLLNR